MKSACDAGKGAKRLLHVGFKVHDIDRTMQAYADLFGIAWEPPATYDLPPSGDQTGPQRSRVTHGWTGDGVEIELVQSLEGQPVDDTVLGEREGVSHLAFLVDDLTRERDQLTARGFSIVHEGSAPRASWIFIKDERLGGALIQFVQLNQ